MSVTVKLSIPNISCNHCVATIQRETKDVAGVEQVQADAGTKTATFTLENENVLPRVKETLAEIGYPATN
jgi:copper chaperone